MFQPRAHFRTLAAIALSGFALASCSGGGNTVPSSIMPERSQAFPSQTLHDDGNVAKALYVSDFYGKSIFRFVRNGDGTLVTPAGSSLVLPYNPGPIAIGRTGNLFVSDEENESIEVYRKGATGSQQPMRTLLLPFVPSCVAVDRNGYEYAGGFSNGFVAVYAPGAHGHANTIQRIALPDGHPDINGVTVDAGGNLYVSDSNEVSEFATPTAKPTLVRAIVGSGEQSSPTGMALANLTGELYVANAGDSNILAYSPTANGHDHPDRRISSNTPPLKGPVAVAVRGSALYSTSGTSLDGAAVGFRFRRSPGRTKPEAGRHRIISVIAAGSRARTVSSVL
jgi:DNA-binding beta-propeller fold protein YncE